MAERALAKVFMIDDFPPPDRPINMFACLILMVSDSSNTFSTNYGEG